MRRQTDVLTVALFAFVTTCFGCSVVAATTSASPGEVSKIEEAPDGGAAPITKDPSSTPAPAAPTKPVWGVCGGSPQECSANSDCVDLCPSGSISECVFSADGNYCLYRVS